MRSLNKVTLIGNLGKEPDFQQLEGGVSLAKFSLATTESYRDKNGDLQHHTEWHSVVAWRTIADIAGKYLKKGSRIYLEGKIKTRHYEDKDGIKRYVTEIIAEELMMLDTPSTKAKINETF